MNHKQYVSQLYKLYWKLFANCPKLLDFFSFSPLSTSGDMSYKCNTQKNKYYLRSRCDKIYIFNIFLCVCLLCVRAMSEIECMRFPPLSLSRDRCVSLRRSLVSWLARLHYSCMHSRERDEDKQIERGQEPDSGWWDIIWNEQNPKNLDGILIEEKQLFLGFIRGNATKGEPQWRRDLFSLFW